MNWPEFIKLTVALVAIVDIPGNVPMYLQQTAPMTPRARRATAIIAGVATAAILLVFANFGETILSAFGITIDAFRILGGIVILLIALEMLGLIGDPDASYRTEEHPNPVVTGIFPLAVPLFAGPGAITAVMIYAHEADISDSHDAHVSLIILVVSLLMVAGLLTASMVGHLIGRVTQTVLNRLLGMIVGALGVEFILEGVSGTVLLHQSQFP